MLIDSYCMGMNVLLYVCACTPCVPDACGDTKAQDLLKPELWVGVSVRKVTNPGSPARAASALRCWSCLNSP